MSGSTMGAFDGMGWGSFSMWIWWILLIILVLWLAKALFSGSDQLSARDKKQGDALEILNQRYAKGEISHQEYEEMRRNISKNN